MATAVSRSTRALLALALLVPLVFSVWWFSRRPRDTDSSRFDEALDRALAPVLELHAASVKLGTSTPTQAKVLARHLAQHSVTYLAPADLELWAAIRLDAARSAPQTCARLWKGGDEAPLRSSIVELGDARLAEWTEMLARGFAVRLERKQPPGVAPGAVPRAMASIVRDLPEAERGAFVRDASRRDLSDARACQLFLTLSTRAQTLAPEARTELYRALAEQLSSTLPPTPAAATH